MFRLLMLFLLFPILSWGQYEEYESYQTFSDLDKKQRDFGLVFTPGFMYSLVDENNEVTGNTANSRTRSLFFYDVKLGYIFRGGFYFGLLYAGEAIDVNESAPKTTRESVGLSFGYIHRGWSFVGTFFPHSKQDLENTADIQKYSEGMGFQIEAGYYFRVSPYFSIGPQLVYKKIRYGEGQDAVTDVSGDSSSSHTVFTPMVSFLVNLYRG